VATGFGAGITPASGKAFGMSVPEVNIGVTQVQSAVSSGSGPVVLQVLPSLTTGGAERGTIEIAAAIVADGGTAIVASEGGPMENDLRRAGGLHLKLPAASKNPIVMYRNIARLEQIIAAYNVDIVHVRSRAPAWSARTACQRSGRHFITTFHAPYNFSNALKKRYNQIMAEGERVIAISEFIAEHVRQNYSVDPARLRVIRRGIDVARFDPDRVSAERMIQLSTRWRLPDGVPLILMPGRLTRWKGQTVLLEALSHLSDLDFRCVMVGSDQGRSAYRRELEALIARYGLGSRATIMDECGDMPAAYMLSDVITLPDGSVRAFDAPVTGAEIAASISKSLAKAALAVRIDGTLHDLATIIDRDASVAIVTARDDDALSLLRHDAAHVMAQAVQELYPGTQVTIGPAIENGFYYDFARDEPFTPDDLDASKRGCARSSTATCRSCARSGTARGDRAFQVHRRDTTRPRSCRDPGRRGAISIYRQGDWLDLCTGPHLPSTGKLGKAFKLMKLAGAYWRGDSRNAMLQRIYGTAWADRSSSRPT
jgi:glycosyltransferase involved in cell wall biosynthesis